MEPRIQYARTADGVAIAYWTLGAGPPLLYLAGGPWSHVELWQIPACRHWYERLADDHILVRYDLRGTGLSDRVVSDYSLNALLLDVEAVVDHLGLTRFVLFGAADAGPVSIAYAARHPERVSRLILWCTWARASDIASPFMEAWLSLIDRDWTLTTETCAHLSLGWSSGEVGRQAAQHLREAVTPAAARVQLGALLQFDTTTLLPQVRAPTLVFHRRDIAWFPPVIARDLVARLPDARLITLAGESTAPYLGDTDQIIRAIDEFLGEDDAAAATGQPHAVRTAPDLGPPPRPAASSPDTLTRREVEVLRRIAGGQTNQEIAEELTLSVRTVERHITNLYAKIDARGRADATAYALTHGLL